MLREVGRGKSPVPPLKSILYPKRAILTFGWFSSGRDQAAIDLFNAVADRLASGFIPGRLAEHAAAYKLGGHGRESYPTKKSCT
ncbi:MAG: hypothetical protein COS90_08320 [Deltaproteobacteria bacterium CG07_land_8_20_14_0_80_60_11]|nr:MAG: hypothetical protein COS90_08320 [Deltaproteobacteria bacterium CG07_land_8_20_14_0_80_60_11]